MLKLFKSVRDFIGIRNPINVMLNETDDELKERILSDFIVWVAVMIICISLIFAFSTV